MDVFSSDHKQCKCLKEGKGRGKRQAVLRSEASLPQKTGPSFNIMDQ